MKVLYLDCGMGAAGDMLMGALVSLLTKEQQSYFADKINSIGIPGVTVTVQNDIKCGVTGKHVEVLIGGVSEGEEHGNDGHDHNSGHTHDHHIHGHGGEDEHQHHHEHSSMRDIEKIIDKLDISNKVREDVKQIYKRIALAESTVHGTTVSEIHFHEVGMMDAIADITGCAMLLELLQVDRVVVSPINVGYGTVKCAHGTLPVPAPATANLLKNIPSYAGDVKGELCTPTGAAILGYYGNEFSNMPLMTIEAVGYGTGKKDFEVANVVRAIVGYSEGGQDSIVELSCNMDDITGEQIGYVTEILLKKGARDVFTTAVTMKKNRPGILLTVLCTDDDKMEMAEIIFKNTTTIGIRELSQKRMILNRREELLKTGFGDVRVKYSSGYGAKRVKAEYEDIADIARKNNLAIQEVIDVINEETREG